MVFATDGSQGWELFELTSKHVFEMSLRTECYGLSGRMDRAPTDDIVITVRGEASGQAFSTTQWVLVRLWPQQLPVPSVGGCPDTETVNSQWT